MWLLCEVLCVSIITDASVFAIYSQSRRERRVYFNPTCHRRSTKSDSCRKSLRQSGFFGKNEGAQLHFREESVDIVTLSDIQALLNVMSSWSLPTRSGQRAGDLVSFPAQLADWNAVTRIWRPKMSESEKNSGRSQDRNEQRRPRLIERAIVTMGHTRVAPPAFGRAAGRDCPRSRRPRTATYYRR